jgi:hypothetical protein
VCRRALLTLEGDDGDRGGAPTKAGAGA